MGYRLCVYGPVYVPHLVQRALVVLQHILILLLKHLDLLWREFLLRMVLLAHVRIHTRGPRILHGRRRRRGRGLAVRSALPKVSPRFRKHTPALLDLAHNPLLHHCCLEAATLLQSAPQVPQHTLAVRADSVSPRLVLLLLNRLGGPAAAVAARSPRPNRAQAYSCVPLARERGLCVLPQLLGVGEVADAGVELA